MAFAETTPELEALCMTMRRPILPLLSDPDNGKLQEAFSSSLKPWIRQMLGRQLVPRTTHTLLGLVNPTQRVGDCSGKETEKNWHCPGPHCRARFAYILDEPSTIDNTLGNGWKNYLCFLLARRHSWSPMIAIWSGLLIRLSIRHGRFREYSGNYSSFI